MIKPHFMYEALGLTKTMQKTSYRELFRYNMVPSLVDEIHEATNGNYVLGNDRFKKEISKVLGRHVQSGRAEMLIKSEY